MVEIGAKPNVPRFQRAALRAVRALSTPLLTDDDLELINPLWSTRELRGRIERIDHVTDDAATVMIKPVNAGRATAPASTYGSASRSGVSGSGAPTR
jgi:stearoyl-CoA 9-desaturase NADPH oxidoreductase